MFRLRYVLFLALATFALAAPIRAAADRSSPEQTVLFVEQHAHRAVTVPAWDPLSPQRLVRIDGELFQKDTRAGLFFKVLPGQITVRLADGVKSWEELVARAAGDAPRTFEILHQLTPLRTNRLSIVDLLVPERTDVADWCALVHTTGLVRYAEVATLGEYHATQNDPQYPQQWALNNTGQTGGTPGADIDAERAWDLTAGDPSIVVAVLDSGTDIDHEDLAANVWHNDAEIPDNGTDDDGNGFVDDWEGWDFDNGDNDPRSGNTHGTVVTGIVNAAGSNGIGIAGVAGGLGGPGVRGMALGVGSGGPNVAIVDDAILYAADNGAHVITMSLSIGEAQAINDALDYAYNVRDVFIDCASGNSGPSVAYPATRPEVMAVAATNDNDQRSFFSNPGPEVEVAAPGSDVLSTKIGDTYGTDSGTSFAAPQVAGVAALVRSRNPGLPAPDVRQLIIDSAEDVEAPGFDEGTGHGRVNAFDAVSLAATSDGTVRLDASDYACESLAAVTVSDIDLAGLTTLAVTLRSDSDPAGESLVLTEVGSSSGLFRGSIATTEGAAAPDGILQVLHGDTVVAEYLDADDGAGGTNVLESATAAVDCLSPVIDGIAVQNLSNDSVTIAWTTDESANGVVRYDELPPPAQSVSQSALTTQHAVDLTGLAECTTYRFEVESGDLVQNVSVDDNTGAYHLFETWGDFPGVGIVPCSMGQVFLDRDTSYGCSDTLGLAVVDVDLDLDPATAEAVQVLVTSTSEPAGEWIGLTELTTESSRFEGSIPLSTAPAVPGDGLLAIGAGDLIAVSYFDADDGLSGARVATDTSTADCSAPLISDVRVTELSSTRAVVEWNTSEPATSAGDFGTTAALGSTVENPALVTAHRIVVSPFEACERVYLRVRSTDEHGETAVADAGGQPLELNLVQIGGLVFHDNFESDSGWQLPGDWERGTPLGMGTANADPSGAWSGSSVIGNDLSGQGAYPGDYEPSTSSSAISPSINTRQQRNLELILQRKLGVTSADEAGIYVITNGTSQVWTSNYHVDDADWTQRSYDISAVADNKQSVQIELRLESSDPDHSFGWNVDELIIKDATEPDYLICGGCAGAPGFAGIKAAYDPDPCAPGGLVVEWEAATAWGTGGGGTYDVYRGTDPGFVPDASDRVASGLTATTWIDTTAPQDVEVWYVVRARNDESCTGDGGLEDANLVRMSATETTSIGLPSPVGDTVSGRRLGGAFVRFEWAPVAGADHYVVTRGQSADFSDAVEIGTTSAMLYEDTGDTSAAAMHLYRVHAVDACGRPE